MSDFFDKETPWEIRNQILTYQTSSLMSDRERAKFLKLPSGCRIRENAKIIKQENLSIGENCYIGEGALLDASGKLKIGSNVSIGTNTFIATHDSSLLNILGKNTREKSKSIKRSPVKIGSNTFIGSLSVIMPGVSIGKQCIIAPMSVVFEDIPDRTTYSPYKDMVDVLKELSEKEKKLDDLLLKVQNLLNDQK